MSIDHIVLDIENANEIESLPGGWRALDSVGVGCAVLYSCLDDSFEIYHQNHTDELRDRILNADRITGFNVYKFDLPVIFGMTLDNWLKSDIHQQTSNKINDLLLRIWVSKGLSPMAFTGAHKGWGLNNVCKGTLNKEKNADSRHAVHWLKSGDWDYVVSYCIQDVKLTRDLSNFIDDYGFVVNGKTQEVLKVWADQEDAINRCNLNVRSKA